MLGEYFGFRVFGLLNQKPEGGASAVDSIVCFVRANGAGGFSIRGELFCPGCGQR